jgi:FkbM family methyltransferase
MAVHPSQHQEEKLVREFFGAQTGFFVEVGANHPTEGSQTWHLEQRGWTGILVEPQPALAAALAEQRRYSQVFAVACTSPESAGRSVPLHVDGARSALDAARMAPGSQVSDIIAVPTRTLDAILQEANAPIPLDFLSIDVEGHEIEVFRGFDFARWRPNLILVEDHVHNLDTHRYLKANGYRLVRRLGFNGWYVPEDAVIRPNITDRWEVLRKYYLALPFRMLRNMSRQWRGK